MIEKIKNIFENFVLKDFFKISFKNSIQVALRFIIGLLNIRVVSYFLGASGLALVGQFNNFVQIITNLSGTGLQQGIVKLCAQYSCSEKKRNLVIGNSLILIVAMSSLVALIIYFFSSQISVLVLHSSDYGKYIRASGLLAFFLSVNNCILGFFNGLQKFRSFISANVWFVLVNFIVSVPFIYWFKIDGAIMAIYIASIINFCIVLFYGRGIVKEALNSIKISLYVNKRLLGFGAMLFFAATIGPFSSILIRNVIISEYSMDAAGLWEGVSRISKNIYSLAVAACSLYYIPYISKSRLKKELDDFIWKTVKVVMPIVVAVISVVFLSRKLIISVLFSSGSEGDFSGMEDLFLFQNIGDMVRIFNWFFSITFMIKEKIKLYMFSEFAMAVVYYLLIYSIIPHVGVENSTLPYMINTIIYLFLSQFLYRKYII